MRPTRLVSVALLFLFLVSACSSKQKTGTVSMRIMEQTRNELVEQVKVDEGREAINFRKVFTKIDGGTKWELIKEGQRVEIEPAAAEEIKTSKAKWKIVRVLEAGK